MNRTDTEADRHAARRIRSTDDRLKAERIQLRRRIDRRRHEHCSTSDAPRSDAR